MEYNILTHREIKLVITANYWASNMVEPCRMYIDNRMFE